MTYEYKLRGNRVVPVNEKHIQNTAINVAKQFGLSKRNRRQTDQAFEKLFAFNIVINPLPDEEWLYLTKGHYDPSTLTITIPQEIYINACIGEQDALFVMLHELGHLFLGHKPVLHFSNSPPTKYEDAEWQADLFAETILKYMGYETTQLSFDFYM